MSDVMGKERAAAVVNIPAELFAAVMTEAQHTITYRRKNRAEFGKLDHIDADGLLEELVETATKLGAAARPGPGGCECVNTLSAELDSARADLAEALKALRAVDAWIAEDDTSAAPLRPESARAARAWVRAAVGNRINIVLLKHPKPDGGAT